MNECDWFISVSITSKSIQDNATDRQIVDEGGDDDDDESVDCKSIFYKTLEKTVGLLFVIVWPKYSKLRVD